MKSSLENITLVLLVILTVIQLYCLMDKTSSKKKSEHFYQPVTTPPKSIAAVAAVLSGK